MFSHILWIIIGIFFIISGIINFNNKFEKGNKNCIWDGMVIGLWTANIILRLIKIFIDLKS